MIKPENYSTVERARMRASTIAPEMAFNDFVAQEVPDQITRRNLHERLRRGDPRTLKLLAQLCDVFQTHLLYWTEEDPEIVRDLAADRKMVAFSAPGDAEQLLQLRDALSGLSDFSVDNLPTDVALAILKARSALQASS